MAKIEGDLAQAFISKERMRFTIEARKKGAAKLAAEGCSTRDIAAITGGSQTTIVRELAAANGSKREPNGSATSLPPRQHVDKVS